jgi:hypothetical protein
MLQNSAYPFCIRHRCHRASICKTRRRIPGACLWVKITDASGVFLPINGNHALATEAGLPGECVWYKFWQEPAGILPIGVEYTLAYEYNAWPGTGVPTQLHLSAQAFWFEGAFHNAFWDFTLDIDEQIDCNWSPDGELEPIVDPNTLLFPSPNPAGTWETLWGNANHNPF